MDQKMSKMAAILDFLNFFGPSNIQMGSVESYPRNVRTKLNFRTIVSVVLSRRYINSFKIRKVFLLSVVTRFQGVPTLGRLLK